MALSLLIKRGESNILKKERKNPISSTSSTVLSPPTCHSRTSIHEKEVQNVVDRGPKEAPVSGKKQLTVYVCVIV